MAGPVRRRGGSPATSRSRPPTISSKKNDDAPATTPATNPQRSAYVSPISVATINSNTKNLSYIHSYVSVLSALAAGIIGLTAYWGLAFYLSISAINMALMAVFKMGGKPRECFKGGVKDMVMKAGIWNGFFSYVMFWTLGYGLVHVY